MPYAISSSSMVLVICTNLSGKEPHRKASDGIRESRWCNGSHTSPECEGIASNPALGAIFPIFHCPSQHLVPEPGSCTIYMLCGC